MTVSTSLRGWPNPDSQANGALMRISPLGIFGASYDLRQVAEWAKQDAELTHMHPICLQANALFAMAIAYAVGTGVSPSALHHNIRMWAGEIDADGALLKTIDAAATTSPSDYVHQQGWVIIAFHNALWQLLHAPNLEEGMADTVAHGGDTDTNAAIAGALLGAVHGRYAVPAQWVGSLLNCRPKAGLPNVRRPRPECYWPVDVLQLAKRLVLPAEDPR
jgi:ADP-ribosylglycohydrolase